MTPTTPPRRLWFIIASTAGAACLLLALLSEASQARNQALQAGIGLLLLSTGMIVVRLIRNQRDLLTWYRLLAHNLPDMGVVLYTPELRALIVEGSIFPPDLRIPPHGVPLNKLPPPIGSEHLLPLFKTALAGEVADLETQIGSDRFFHVRAAPVPHQRAPEAQLADERIYRMRMMPVPGRRGRIVGAIAIIRDVTARHNELRVLADSEAQLAQAQKMEGLGRLAGGIAHDFNNLLTALHGIAELMLMQTTPYSQLHEDVGEILLVSRRAMALVRQLLTFARRQPLSPRQLDLGALLVEATPLFKRLVTAQVELAVLPEPDTPAVIADPIQIEQVLTNLVVNARDAMPNGGKLTITAGACAVTEDTIPTLPAGNYACITVHDTGYGMPPDVLARALEPFFTTKGINGTGIGLSTSYGIVKQHGGTMLIASAIGEGTTITVYIPDATHSPLPDRSEEFAIGSAPTKGLVHGRGTIVVVDDFDSVRHFAKRALQTCGYTVYTAASGPDALDLLGGHAIVPDLVISDMFMPLMGGGELLSQVRARFPSLPILLMSGYTEDPHGLAELLDANTTYLQKPFTASELSRAVKDALATR